MDSVERITNALRNALNAYAQLEPHGTARASIAVALFGVSASKHLLRLLDVVAANVQTARKA